MAPCALTHQKIIMKHIAILGFAVGLLSLTACKKEDPQVVTFEDVLLTHMDEIESQSIGDYTLSIYSSNELIVGYNELNFLLKDADGEFVTDYTMHAHPMMEMGMMMHTTPHGHTEMIEGEYGLYMTDYVFIMPSTAGTWSLEVTVEVDDESVVYDFVLDVIEPEEARMISFMSKTGSEEKYFAALVGAENFGVGENDFEIAIYQRESMMSFPAVTYLTVEIEPWMPTMEHGSPNNVNPVHTMNGHYAGVANFTMTGFWQLKLTIKNADGEIVEEDLAFDITL